MSVISFGIKVVLGSNSQIATDYLLVYNCSSRTTIAHMGLISGANPFSIPSVF